MTIKVTTIKRTVYFIITAQCPFYANLLSPYRHRVAERAYDEQIGTIKELYSLYHFTKYYNNHNISKNLLGIIIFSNHGLPTCKKAPLIKCSFSFNPTLTSIFLTNS